MHSHKKYNPFIDWVFFLCYCIFFWLFIAAFTNPSYKITIDINAFGEAILELILFTGFFLFGLIKLFWDIHTKTNTKKEKIYLLGLLTFMFLLIIFGSPLLRLVLLL